MSSVDTLLSLCIAQYYPEQMMEIIDIADKNGYNFNFIKQNLTKYDTSLEKMHDFNKRFEPWWGLPHRIEAYTTNKSIMRDE